MHTYICGDLHGDASRILQWNNAVENSTLIHVGDLCIVQYDLESLSYKLNKRGNKFISCRGNHEVSQEYDFGFKIGEAIELVADYSFRTINGKNYFFIGGAISLDRKHRLAFKERYPHRENWYREDEALIYKPELIPADIDVLITHTAPPEFLPKADPLFLKKFADQDDKLMVDILQERANITAIYDFCAANTRATRSFFGHWHMSERGIYKGIQYTGLNIKEIIENQY